MQYLVATDSSPESDSAVTFAARLAGAFDADVELVHVLTPETRIVDAETAVEGGTPNKEAGFEILERAAEHFESTATDWNGTLRTQLLAGRPAHAIVEQATAIDADHIFVGHRGVSEGATKAIGSVAKGVLDDASIPVTVVR